MYGYGNGANTATAMTDLDGRTCVSAETGSFSAPLFCLFSNSKNFVLLGMIGSVRLRLSLHDVGSFFQSNVVVALVEIPLNFILSNVELCYSMLDFGSQVDSYLIGSGEPFVIKSKSILASTSTIPLVATRYQEVVYSMRLASIKSIFILPTVNAVTSINGIFDFFDITKGGEISVSISGKYYPSKPLSCDINKTGKLHLG